MPDLTTFTPTKRVYKKLPSGRSVVVFGDGTGRVGLQFVNDKKEVTRCLLSEEATAALAAALAVIMRGDGEPHLTEAKAVWRCVSHKLEVE